MYKKIKEIDLTKAPDGATHYCLEGSKYGNLVYKEHWIKPGFYCLSGLSDWKEDKIGTPKEILIELQRLSIDINEREEAIFGIYQTVCISRAQAEAIYDAGYRKR